MSAAGWTIAPPGGLVWLLRHELRVTARRFTVDPRRRPFAIGLMLLAFAVLHLFAISLVRLVDRMPDTVPTAVFFPLLGSLAALLTAQMTALGLTNSVRALFERGTLDLVLSAPIPARRVLVIRAATLVLTTTLPFAALILPLAHVGFLAGDARWLVLYPVTVAVGLIGTSIGLALALVLVRIVGPRLTRTVGQLLAVLIATSLGVAIQSFNGKTDSDKLSTLEHFIQNDPDHPGLKLIQLAGRAMLGETQPLLMLLAIGVVSFVVMVALSGPSFRRSVVAAGGGVALSGAVDGRIFRVRFGLAPAAALRRKEIRLLLRDPWALMPVVQRALALLPVCLILTRFDTSNGTPTGALVPLLVVFAGKLAGVLSWMTLSSEGAPELIGTAPVRPGLTTRIKIEVALTATACLFLIPIVLMALESPSHAAIALLGCLAATIAATRLAIADIRAARRDFGDRFRHSAAFTVAELCVTLAIAATAWASILSSPVVTLASLSATGLLFLLCLRAVTPSR